MKFSPLWFSSIFLCASLCCSVEDDFDYDYYQFEIDNLIFIDENETSFTSGDTIWINTEIPAELTDVMGDSYNLNTLTEQTELSYHTLTLYERTGFVNPAVISLSESEIIVEEGLVNLSNEFITVNPIFNGSVYSSRFGVVLNATGEYYFASFYDTNKNEIYLDSNNNTQVYIETTINESNTNNQYEFLVE